MTDNGSTVGREHAPLSPIATMPARNREGVGLRLDLACGKRVAEGFVGVDQDHTLQGVGHCANLALAPWVLQDVREDGSLGPGYTLEDNSVAALHCSHFVEHVVDLVAFMNECHRVLEPAGVLTIKHPYQFSVCAWQDPTHVRALNEVSWLYFDANFRGANMLEHYLGITADFDVAEVVPSSVHPDYASMAPEAFHKAMRHRVNVCHELTVTLLKR